MLGCADLSKLAQRANVNGFGTQDFKQLRIPLGQTLLWRSRRWAPNAKQQVKKHSSKQQAKPFRSMGSQHVQNLKARNQWNGAIAKKASGCAAKKETGKAPEAITTRDLGPGGLGADAPSGHGELLTPQKAGDGTEKGARRVKREAGGGNPEEAEGQDLGRPQAEVPGTRKRGTERSRRTEGRNRERRPGPEPGGPRIFKTRAAGRRRGQRPEQSGNGS